MHPGPEARQAPPAAARQSKATLEKGDASLHAGAETLELNVPPGGRRHVRRFQSAPLAEHRMLHAQRPGLFQVFLRGVTAVEGGVGRRFAIVLAMTFQHGQTACAVRGISGLHHHIEHQTATARGQIDLVAKRGLAPAFADDVRVRLEQADDLFRGRHVLRKQHASRRLHDHAT